MSYQNKYIKYKNKYLDLKNQIGGSTINDTRSAAAHDVESTCSICLNPFNNTDRKPVGLHDTINDKNITTSPEHFICTRCYHTNKFSVCPTCRDPIDPENTKIYDYDINTHRIANPLVSIPYNKNYVLPQYSSCSFCLDPYNNTDRKPVGLHKHKKGKESNQHFVCLKCYKIHTAISIRTQCVVCGLKIIDLEAKIYNYDIDKQIIIIAEPGEFVLERVEKSFKRRDGKRITDGGGRGSAVDYLYSEYTFLCTCGNPNINCPCINNINNQEKKKKSLTKKEFDESKLHHHRDKITD